VLAATGKGFRFPDEATAKAIAQRFEDRANSMKGREMLIGRALRALHREFSPDDYSKAYVKRTIESLESLRELNKSAAEYARSYCDQIKGSMDSKMSDDDAAGKWFNKVGNTVQ
jgi:hypothetical protein